MSAYPHTDTTSTSTPKFQTLNASSYTDIVQY